MKTLRALALGCGLVGLATTQAWSAAAPAPKSDVVPPQKRQATVDKALRLTKAPAPLQLPPDLVQPFNPANFDAPDQEDPKPGPNPGPNPPGPKPAPTISSDRELLEAMAPRIQPTGALVVSGRPPVLTFAGAKRARVGDVLQVQFNEKEYDIEITAIDRTNFTLRFRGEELTRPIKPIK